MPSEDWSVWKSVPQLCRNKRWRFLRVGSIAWFTCRGQRICIQRGVQRSWKYLCLLWQSIFHLRDVQVDHFKWQMLSDLIRVFQNPIYGRKYYQVFLGRQYQESWWITIIHRMMSRKFLWKYTRIKKVYSRVDDHANENAKSTPDFSGNDTHKWHHNCLKKHSGHSYVDPICIGSWIPFVSQVRDHISTQISWK